MNKITPDVENLLKLSVLINENSPEGYKENFAYSFTSILLAFMIAEDPLSKWFQNFIETERINTRTILEEKHITKEKWEDIIKNKRGVPKLKLHAWTSSARTVFTIAEEYLRHLQNMASNNERKEANGPGVLELRHIMGAYTYGNHGHEQQMSNWGFKTDILSMAFVSKLWKLGIPSYELEYWKGIHANKFGLFS